MSAKRVSVQPADRHFCKPEDIALKSFFLGPQSENAIWFQSCVDQLLRRWFEWRQNKFIEDGRAISSKDQASAAFKACRSDIDQALALLSTRLEDEVPKYSPRYVGHMFSEVSLPAMLGHIAALLHNPNIISGESARVGVQIEDEAIADLAKMVGYESPHAAGHFTSGGTVANYEAVLRAKFRVAIWLSAGAAYAECYGTIPDPFQDAAMGWPKFLQLCDDIKAKSVDLTQRLKNWNFESLGFHKFQRKYMDTFHVPLQHPVLLVSAHCHYSWPKAAAFLGFGDETIRAIELNADGVMDIGDLKTQIDRARLNAHPVLMITSVMGTTELGAVDPIAEIHESLRYFKDVKNSDFWHHIDAAYGGFLCSMGDSQLSGCSSRLKQALRAACQSTSITIDPHKLGYVPYSAGVILIRDAKDYGLKSIDAPYIQYSGTDKGPFTFEGSRPATGAAATWMISKSLGFDSDGFGRIVARTIANKQTVERELQKIGPPVYVADHADSNIVCFVVAGKEEFHQQTNERTETIYKRLSGKQNAPFIVSKTTLYHSDYSKYLLRLTARWNGRMDEHGLTLIRMCLMNPFFTSKETDVDYVSELVAVIANVAKHSMD